MSNSLSQSAAKTIRPTKVRASVGSSTSGSSARPTRRVCEWAASEAKPTGAPAGRGRGGGGGAASGGGGRRSRGARRRGGGRRGSWGQVSGESMNDGAVGEAAVL